MKIIPPADQCRKEFFRRSSYSSFSRNYCPSVHCFPDLSTLYYVLVGESCIKYYVRSLVSLPLARYKRAEHKHNRRSTSINYSTACISATEHAHTRTASLSPQIQANSRLTRLMAPEKNRHRCHLFHTRTRSSMHDMNGKEIKKSGFLAFPRRLITFSLECRARIMPCVYAVHPSTIELEVNQGRKNHTRLLLSCRHGVRF